MVFDVQFFINRGKNLLNSLKPIEDTLKGKKILITGANQGLGFEQAQECGQRGASVIITVRDKSKGEKAVQELSKNGAQYNFVVLDQLDDTSISHAFKEIKSKFAPLDVFVCNAAAGGLDDSRKRFEILMNTNVHGTVKVAYQAADVLKEGGKLILLASELGHPSCVEPVYQKHLNEATKIDDKIFTDVPYHEYSGHHGIYYVTSKAIAIKYAQLAAKDPHFKNGHISVSAVNPGFNVTNLNKTDNAPLQPNQGAHSVVWQIATKEDINGGFYEFGHTIDMKGELSS